MDDLAPDDTLLSGLSVGSMILMGLGLVDDSSWDGIATAGAAAFVTSLFVPDVAAGNRDKCTRLGNATSRDVCRLAADFLAHEVEDEPTGLVRDAVDWAKDRPGHLAERTDRGKEAFANVAGELLPDDVLQERQDAEPLSSETPPPIGSRVSGEASGPGATVAQVEGDITLGGDFAVTGDDDRDLSVVISGSVADDNTADSGVLTPTLTGTGTLSLRAMGDVGVAGDNIEDSATFGWGGHSGNVRSVRSAVVLSGNAPVVVRTILFLKGPRDGRVATLDLSEYISDPNRDSMRFTAAVSSFQSDLDVRVSGSTLSIRQKTPDLNLTTRVRVTATDPGGLEAQMSFVVKTYASKAVLWTSSYYPNPPDLNLVVCVEYVILDRDAYERAYVRGDRTAHWVHAPWHVDRRFGKLNCSNNYCDWSDGLNCPDSFVSSGGCQKTSDWGIFTRFYRYDKTSQSYKDHAKARCRRVGETWITERPQSTINLQQQTKDPIRNWIINYFDVPGRGRCDGVMKYGSCSRTVAIGVRG